MSLDKIIVSIFGVTGVIFTYWYFLGKKETRVAAKDSIDITVSGGYKPSTIIVPVGKTTTLYFTRTEDNSCLEEIVLPDLKIRRSLPLNEKVAISITPEKPGEYPFSCGMNMFHGKIIVK